MKLPTIPAVMAPLLRRSVNSDIVAIAVTLLAIIGVFFPFWFPALAKHLNTTPETLAMLIAVVLFLAGDRFIDIVRHYDTTKAISELVGPASQAITCTYVGTYMEALEYFKGRIKFAESVKDTIITYKIAPKELDIYFFDTDDAASVQKMISDHVNRGRIYRAVISGKVVDNIYKDNQIPIAIDKNNKHFFHIKTIDTEFPIMNFTILEYGMGEANREVLFGWGHHIHDEVGHVFSSRDRKIVDTFERLFESLVNSAQDWPKEEEETKAILHDRFEGLLLSLIKAANDWPKTEVHAVSGGGDRDHQDGTPRQAAK